jgi:hypothetical protein
MVGRRWGLEVDARAVTARVPPANERGVQLGHLRAAARRMGLEAFAIRGDRDMLLYELKAGRPVIVGLLLDATGDSPRSHYEVVAAAHPERDLVVTVDPMRGWVVREWVELSSAWEAAGQPALVVLGRLATPAEVNRAP